ncbi:hypothetical protein [Stenotrophomonas phage StenR_269]|nr:hypothetical protein [Stenotrophomonas phage StenR_269]
MKDKKLKKIVFSYASETCPTVDSWFDYLIDELVEYCGEDSAESITQMVDECREKVKADGTILLRDAMYAMAADMADVQDEVDRLKSVINGD